MIEKSIFEINEEKQLQREAEMFHLEIIDKILKVMKKNEISKKQLADEMKVTKGYVSQLFAGDKLLNFKTMIKLQNILGIIFKVDIQTHLYRSNSDGKNDVWQSRNHSDFSFFECNKKHNQWAS